MIFWRTVTIRLRSRATRYDGVHAGYGYLQLHHQAPTGDSGRKVREARRIVECVRDDRRGVTLWRSKGGSAETRRAGRGVFGTTCDSRLDQRSYGPLCADSPIGNMDLLIASHAVSQRMVLVTNNLKHFANVPGLTVEVWS